MQIEMLKSKLHQACITDADVNYEGSFGVDTELMEAVGLHPYEKLLIANINNGARYETYAIPEPFGSRRMVARGAAARLGCVGDRVIIMSFCMVEEALVRSGQFRPRVLRLDESNDPVSPIPSRPTAAEVSSMLGG
jgi:aspartate 1-decarboxylase